MMTDYLPQYRQYLAAQDNAPLTIRGYLADLAHFARWFQQTNGEALTPERLTPTDVREYKQFLLAVEHRKASTVNRRLAALSAFARWAQGAGLIHSDPTERIKSVAQEMLAPKWLDRNEQYALQRAIERDLQLARMRYTKRVITRQRDAALVVFMLHTGLRLGEIIALRLGDLQISERKGSVLVRQGKGSKQRTVPLNAEARKALREWLDVRPQSGDDRVWVSVESDSGGLSARGVQRILKRYAQDAGLEQLSPHVLRHSFAKNLVNSGVGLEKIATLLGHSSLNTTRMYITPDERDLELAVENLVIQ